jgi:hypothetical protein
MEPAVKEKPTFLTLPVEIRLMIYEELVLGPKILVDPASKTLFILDYGRWPMSFDCATASSVRNNFTVLRTCKQVNHQAAPVVYGQNIFMFVSPSYFKNFLSCIGPENVQSLRMLDLTFHFDKASEWIRCLQENSADLKLRIIRIVSLPGCRLVRGTMEEGMKTVRALAEIKAREFYIFGYYEMEWLEYLRKALKKRAFLFMNPKFPLCTLEFYYLKLEGLED